MANGGIVDPNDIDPSTIGGPMAPRRPTGAVNVAGAGRVVHPSEIDPSSIGVPHYPVSTPGEATSRLAGLPGKIGRALIPPNPREDPVGFGQWATQAALAGASLIPGVGDIPILGYLAESGIGPAAARTVTMAGVGGATAAATGQPIARSALTSGLVGGAGEIPGLVARPFSGLSTALAAGSGAMRESEADVAAQRAIENELGVTRERAGRLAAPSTIAEGAPQELAGGKRALGEARLGAIHEVGQQYEPIYGPIENQPATIDQLKSIGVGSRSATAEYTARGAQISPAARKLLDRQAALGEPVVGVDQLQGPITELIRGSKNVDPQTKARFTQLINNEIQAKGERVQPQRLRELASQALGVTAGGGPTIGTLRGHLGQLMQQANQPGTSAIERSALFKAGKPVVEALNQAVPEEQRPLLQQINNEYTQVNRIFPWKAAKRISQASTIPELGELAFGKGNVAASAMAIPRMTDEQKGLMRRAFGAYILNETDSPTKTLSKLAENKAVTKALFEGTPFENIRGWRDAMIAQKKFVQGPKNLASQKEFEAGVQDAIKRSGLTEEAVQAANTAVANKLNHSGRAERFLTSPWVLFGGLAGYGMLGHVPSAVYPAVVYLGGKAGMRALADNPAALNWYREAIMSGWTRKGGDAFARLAVMGVNDALRGTNQPERQAVGHMPDMSEGYGALQQYRAEHIAPTASAADRAFDVARQLERGRRPQVDQDLNAGRLTHTEIDRLLQYASSKDAGKLIAGIPISEVLDAVEVASPEEKRILMPLVQQRLRQELPQQTNRTLQANLAQRYRRLQGAAA